MTIGRALAAAGAAVVAACASAPADGLADYAPLSPETGYGFAERRLDSYIYEVRFDAPGGVGREQVRDLALRRAAEITLRDGYDWFDVIAFEAEGGDPAPTSGAEPDDAGCVHCVVADIDHAGAARLRSDRRVEPLPEPTGVAESLTIRIGRGDQPPGARVHDAAALLERYVGDGDAATG